MRVLIEYLCFLHLFMVYLVKCKCFIYLSTEEPVLLLSYRWFVELWKAQGAKTGSPACQGHAGCGGAPVGFIGWAGLHYQHPHTLCGGKWASSILLGFCYIPCLHRKQSWREKKNPEVPFNVITQQLRVWDEGSFSSICWHSLCVCVLWRVLGN